MQQQGDKGPVLSRDSRSTLHRADEAYGLPAAAADRAVSNNQVQAASADIRQTNRGTLDLVTHQFVGDQDVVICADVISICHCSPIVMCYWYTWRPGTNKLGCCAGPSFCELLSDSEVALRIALAGVLPILLCTSTADRLHFLRARTLAVISVRAWRHISACSFEHAGRLCTCKPQSPSRCVPEHALSEAD